MQTSYFSKSAKDPNAVSIARRAPAGFAGKQYKKLAPKNWFFLKYKEDGDEAFFKEQYQNKVLALLDPKTVYEELGGQAVLLCWEGKGKFCHRRLVAEWLESNLHIQIPELK